MVLDPVTGAVLALASAPGFDPARFGDVDGDGRRCRPLADAFEPGSTFKVVTFAAALDSGTVGDERRRRLRERGAHDRVDDDPRARPQGRTRRCRSRRCSRAPPTSGARASGSPSAGARSTSPSARSASGRGAGSTSTARRPASLESPPSWSALTLPTMSFGQEIGVTVLQIARAYAAIAHDGLLPTPYLVSEIRRSDREIQRIAPRPPERVVSSATARTLRRFMTGVVVAGTGTARVDSGVHGRRQDRHRAEGRARRRLLERQARRVVRRLRAGGEGADRRGRRRGRAEGEVLRRRRGRAGLLRDRGRGAAPSRRAGGAARSCPGDPRGRSVARDSRRGARGRAPRPRVEPLRRPARRRRPTAPCRT